MKISSKGRYAVRVMAELGKNPESSMSVTELSQKQGITIKYLEKIISLLSKAKLIEGFRGSQGGYRLLRTPEKYSIAEILKATNDLPELAPCMSSNEKCPRLNMCDSIGCWEKLNSLITDYLNKVSLKDLIDKKF